MGSRRSAVGLTAALLLGVAGTARAAVTKDRIEELPGWKMPINEMREPGDLPAEAKAFIAVVEREVGVRVNVVGVGAERDDYLIWETTT